MAPPPPLERRCDDLPVGSLFTVTVYTSHSMLLKWAKGKSQLVVLGGEVLVNLKFSG